MKRYDQNTSTPDKELVDMYKLTPNPVRDGRIVSDMTFAVRLYKFLEQVEVCDCPGDEEKEYLMGVTRRLINRQMATANTAVETEYLKQLGL